MTQPQPPPRSPSRVHLRTAHASDEAATRAWLPEAIAAIGDRRWSQHPPAGLNELRQTLPSDQELFIVALADDEPVGVLVLADGSEQSRIEALTIAAPRRNLSLGAEAVYAAEERAAGPLLAGVPTDNGLAIYFWLRVGYRPVYPAPAAVSLTTGRIWFTRATI